MNLLTLDFGRDSAQCAVMAKEGNEVVENFSVLSQDERLETLIPHYLRVGELHGIDGIAIISCGAVNLESSVTHGQKAPKETYSLVTKSSKE